MYFFSSGTEHQAYSWNCSIPDQCVLSDGTSESEMQMASIQYLLFPQRGEQLLEQWTSLPKAKCQPL